MLRSSVVQRRDWDSWIGLGLVGVVREWPGEAVAGRNWRSKGMRSRQCMAGTLKE